MQKQEGFDLTNKLRLGSTDDTTAHTHNSHFGGRVIFSDPCLMCGNKKRRMFVIEESQSEPRRKKVFVDPISVKHPENPQPSASILTPPQQSSSPEPNSSLDLFRRCNTFPSRSPASNNAPAQPDYFTCPVPDLGSSGGRSEVASPATASVPPRHTAPLLRSDSDLTPSPVSRAHKSASPSRVIGPTFLCTRESPVEKRWKRTKEGSKETKNWLKSVEEDDPKDEYAPGNLGNDITKKKDVSEIVPGENVELEEESDALPIIHRCCCGKQFQFHLSLRSI